MEPQELIWFILTVWTSRKKKKEEEGSIHSFLSEVCIFLRVGRYFLAAPVVFVFLLYTWQVSIMSWFKETFASGRIFIYKMELECHVIVHVRVSKDKFISLFSSLGLSNSLFSLLDDDMMYYLNIISYIFNIMKIILFGAVL